MFKVGIALRGGALLGVLASAVVISGCAAEKDPSVKTGAMAGVGSCHEYRQELDRLDAQGVPQLIESANNGKKLSASQRGEVNRYNQLLNEYLGARCHLR